MARLRTWMAPSTSPRRSSALSVFGGLAIGDGAWSWGALGFPRAGVGGGEARGAGVMVTAGVRAGVSVGGGRPMAGLRTGKSVGSGVRAGVGTGAGAGG